ncbi:MAG TPA: ATP-binding protein [Allosphingosinicella sp.]|nr:ATP-binding protein [Allosphingosinicella sp.]
MSEKRTLAHYPRYAAGRARVILSDTPVLGIIGPRQSGKTTLAKEIGSDRRFISLDNAVTRAAALDDPISIVRDVDSAIIDEIQHVPELMLTIKETVDSDRRPGRFIVTGSANILTIQKMQESLAGRIELLTLLPLGQDELEDDGPAHFLDRLFAGDSFLTADRDRALAERVLTGGYPDVIARQSERRRDWFTAYARAVVERDLPDIANVERVADLPRLLQMLALVNGQPVNATELGRRLQIDRKTAQRYLALVEQIFVIRTLPAWSSNAVKQLMKAPKMHFVDSGLAAAVANITAPALDEDRTPFGNLLESFVLAELDKQCAWSKGRYAFSHYRNKDGAEVDIVVENQDGRIAGIEVKAAATVGRKDFAGLAKLAAVAGNRFAGGVVLYDGEHSLPFGEGKRAVPISALWSPDDRK